MAKRLKTSSDDWYKAIMFNENEDKIQRKHSFPTTSGGRIEKNKKLANNICEEYGLGDEQVK